MKTKTLILSIAMALPAPWYVVHAADAPPRPPGAPKDGERRPGPRDGERPKGGDGPREGQRPPGPMPAPLVRPLDKDEDGIISSDEIKNAPDSLKALDKNKDGKLTRDEWQPQPPPPPQGERERRGGQRDSERTKGGERDAAAKTPDKKANDWPFGKDKDKGATTGTTTAGGDTKGSTDKPAGDGQRRGERPPGPPMPLIEALDTDGDGVISADEIGKSPESLGKLDKNGDGQLGPREYLPQPPPGPREGGPEGGKPDRKAEQ